MTTMVFTHPLRYADREDRIGTMAIRKSGDDRDEQFRALYDRHYPRVFRFYRGHQIQPDDAHDLAQEVFAKIFEKFEQYRGENEWAFLQKAARNRLINWWRDRSAGKRKGVNVDIDAPDVAHELVAPQGPDYVEQQETDLRVKRLYDEIRRLTPGQQECIRLQLADHTYEEIAAELRISVDAVKSRRRDALRQLKARLGDEPGGIALPGGDPEDEQ
jgi:RNA polymerase sigma factor (sigma-70 family)